MIAICWLSKTGTRKRMLTSLPLSQTLGHNKSTQAPFTNRMGNGRQTRKRHLMILTSSAKAELTSAKVTSMTARKRLWRVGHSFSTERAHVKDGHKTPEKKVGIAFAQFKSFAACRGIPSQPVKIDIFSNASSLMIH